MIKKGDIFVIVFFVSAAILMWIEMFLFVPFGDRILKIYSNGAIYAEYNLDDIKSEEIIGLEVSDNLEVCISKSGAYVKTANCPDGLCIKQGKISKVNQTVVCVPNKVLMEIVSKKEVSGVDAVAY